MHLWVTSLNNGDTDQPHTCRYFQASFCSAPSCLASKPSHLWRATLGCRPCRNPILVFPSKLVHCGPQCEPGPCLGLFLVKGGFSASIVCLGLHAESKSEMYEMLNKDPESLQRCFDHTSSTILAREAGEGGRETWRRKKEGRVGRKIEREGGRRRESQGWRETPHTYNVQSTHHHADRPEWHFHIYVLFGLTSLITACVQDLLYLSP